MPKLKLQEVNVNVSVGKKENLCTVLKFSDCTERLMVSKKFIRKGTITQKA